MQRTWRAAALAVAITALAATAYAMDVRSGDHVLLEGDAQDVVFASGEEVQIRVLHAQDDVFAAGRDISATQSTAQHLFLAGRTISLVGTNATDVIAAGEQVGIVSGEISDDVIAAGDRVNLGSGARINGSVVLAGNMLRIDAPIRAGLRATGRSIQLNANVDGNVYLTGESIVIGPGVHITGDLVHRGRHVEIAPDARIDGQVRALPARGGQDGRGMMAGAGFAFFAMLLGLAIMAAIAALVLPKLMSHAARAAHGKPWLSLGVGLLIAIVAPIVIGILAVTLIGLPLAFLVGVIMLALWPLAISAAAYALGAFGRVRLRKPEAPPGAGARVLWTGLGMIVLIVIGLIPFIGWLFWMAAYFLGLGAVVTALRGLLRPEAPVAAAS